MSLYPLTAAFVFLALVSRAAPNPEQPSNLFKGGWNAWLCPAGISQDHNKCSHFIVYLYEANGKLCGAHAFATAGGNRTDDGSAPSIVGAIVGSSAEIAITSGRADPPVTIRARITRKGVRLRWKTLDSMQGDYLLSPDVWLTRDNSPVFSDEFALRLKAACAK